MGMFRSTMIAAVLAIGASAASATPVTIQAQNSSNIFNGGGFASVKVDDNNLTRNLSAGGFRLTDGASNFVAWCLDLATTLKLPSKYTVTSTPYSNTSGTFTASVQSNLQKLFNTSYSTLDLNNNARSAGFQLAMWEIIGEKNANLTLKTGSFRDVSGASAARNAANTFLSQLNGPVTQQYELSFFESGKDAHGHQLSQNLVTVAPIPLPAAAWLLGGGLVLMAGIARRRRKAEVA